MEADGLDRFVNMASREEWLIPDDPRNPKDVYWYVSTAQHYKLPFTLLQFVCDGKDFDTVRRFQLDIDSVWQDCRSGEHFALTKGRALISLYEALRMTVTARATWGPSAAGDADMEGTNNTNDMSNQHPNT